jgi:DNA polymerase-3 subunit gamma/tau
MGTVSHAYLFSGPRGSGKTTLARLLAKALNCQNRKERTFEPCNSCSSCNEINESRAIDLIEIDAASNRGIDEIRELRDGIRFRPTKTKYKVFIIDESHQLSKDAANALLKTLEEPPAHAIFILATTELHKMIPTIVSRCQRFDFRKLTIQEIVKRLELLAVKEKVKIEKPALELIALNSGGALRDAESLLDQVLTFGAGTAEEIKDLLGMVDTAVAQEFAKALINYLRQSLILKINSELTNSVLAGFTSQEQQKLHSQIVEWPEAKIHLTLKLFLEAQNQMKYSPIPQLPLELAIIESLQKGQ